MGQNLLRWLVLIIVLANVLFNSLYSQLTGLPAIGEVSGNYETFFTPAGYTFSIWGIIYISLIIYSIIQLLPGRRSIKVYDEIAPYVIANNILGSVWILLFVTGNLLLSLLVIVTMLFTAFMMARISSMGVGRNEINLMIVFPFGILYGWLIAASAANLWIFLTSKGNAFSENIYVITGTMIIIWLAALITGFKINEYFNWLALGWALLGIFIKHQSEYGNIAFLPMVLGAIMIPWSFYLLYMRWKENK